jgi:hypothetical protein
LLDRGATLRGPISNHTWLEIEVMNIILRRYEIIKTGPDWDARAATKEPIAGEEAIKYNVYLDERDKLGSDSSYGLAEWQYLCLRGRPCDPSLTNDKQER